MSLRVLKEVGGDRRKRTPVRRGKAVARPEWEAMVEVVEGILGWEWREVILRHGDWGRDGLLAVAMRHLGWRLGEVVGKGPGVSYAAAAQGIRRFWKRTPEPVNQTDAGEDQPCTSEPSLSRWVGGGTAGIGQEGRMDRMLPWAGRSAALSG
jgi:hypothetical protein